MLKNLFRNEPSAIYKSEGGDYVLFDNGGFMAPVSEQKLTPEEESARSKKIQRDLVQSFLESQVNKPGFGDIKSMLRKNVPGFKDIAIDTDSLTGDQVYRAIWED